jgi:hypothetical protein
MAGGVPYDGRVSDHPKVPDLPHRDELSALPSPAARVVAFVAILLGGLAGGLIGYTLVQLQCDGECAAQRGLGAMVGSIIAAGGTSIVAVLVLRATGEWRQLDMQRRAR